MAAVVTTGANSHGSREARRRRIVERGSERLALITGRIESLPPDPDPDQSHSSTSQPPADSAHHEEIASSPSLPNQESGTEPSQHDIIAETVEPLPSNIEETKSTVAGPVASQGIEEELSQISSSTRSSAQNQQRERSHHFSFTTVQICDAITATENIRMWCSVAAAILVVLSYIGFPILGCHSIRSIIIFRPLYLLLLTNMSIVLARLLLATQGAEIRMGQTSGVPALGGNALVDQLGKALESGLLLQNIFRALFMDFSIYAVILLCGLTLVR
ncbi:hypothetical protein CDL12_27621 [Handroanthus impetiginosus]|uniref:Uncharacterized protein n=1 Tax=Handroanthus impetiginosus TaxID=429701 RepID=A0A2G9G4P1_9LAMI|nr:hypothetical protein CDL12_27621 [Handroanthus impetiginosus]